MKSALSADFRNIYDLDIKDLEVTSEDCLHLNVYTPSLSGKRPVMVFIHGGGFIVGMYTSYLYHTYNIITCIQYQL